MRRQEGKSSRGCCSHVHLHTPAATLHPYPHPSLACSLICLTSSFVHRTSSGMAVKWCARLACGTVGPCKLFTCIHFAPIHPHTHPHTHPYARAQTWHPVMPVVWVNSVFKSECLLQLGLQGSISDCFLACVAEMIPKQLKFTHGYTYLIFLWFKFEYLWILRVYDGLISLQSSLNNIWSVENSQMMV